ncbi:MAG: ATP-binding cassette domain-containing protein [Gammaproteobacteria bacterium]|jgi:ATP-binding cassette subfamily F protein 3|nr:ATP-binding cassette domain-containing protein [Gammaproteobacteria bacterium]
MIQLHNIHLLRGGQSLLKDAHLSLHSGQRYGLVGRNGTGKTSLFKLLLGELQVDSGELQLPPNLRLAHMAQELGDIARTAVDHVLDGDQPYRQAEQAIQQAQQNQDDTALAQAWADYDQLAGYTAENRAQQLLQGLGFQESDWQQPVANFSGGWRVRLNLAQALMCPSDLLLLDEPTNHLDLDATMWLEGWLQSYPGTLLLISHDRDFLDQVVQTIVHLQQQQLTSYRGNYAAFERQKAERMAQQQSMYDKQQAEIAHIESFIRRFKAKASKAKQAQGRVKALERMELIAPAYADSPFSFRFPEFSQTSANLIALNQVSIGYNQPLLEANLSILQDSRIALLGPNGAGKSSLIKTLVGDVPPLAGQIVTGEHLKIGYFAQHQLQALDLQAHGLLHLQRLQPQASEQELRNFLGSFGWQGERVFEPVKNFSGGEKVRLALAMIALQKPNLLLLDEPTNHLDLEARHALTRALQEYQGAVLVISHDRHLLRQVVDQYWLLADGKIAPYAGDLDSYQQHLQKLVQQQAKARQQETRASRQESSGNSLSAQDRKLQKRQQAAQRAQLSPLKKQLHKLECELDKTQTLLREMEQQLTDPSLYLSEQKEQLRALLHQQTQASQQAAELEDSWLLCQEQLEQLQS